MNNYFDFFEDYNLQRDELYSTMLSTVELESIDENKNQQKKSGADRLILINDLAIMGECLLQTPSVIFHVFLKGNV